ncbi:hypothetical protein E4T56_gene12197 [Termitomyces sp. T112]|nr:hypothetical protein E4T56_gene12197 [Termitomyces sp. T112]
MGFPTTGAQVELENTYQTSTPPSPRSIRTGSAISMLCANLPAAVFLHMLVTFLILTSALIIVPETILTLHETSMVARFGAETLSVALFIIKLQRNHPALLPRPPFPPPPPRFRLLMMLITQSPDPGLGAGDKSATGHSALFSVVSL